MCSARNSVRWVAHFWVGILLLLPGSTWGETLLRWKFMAGQELSLDLVQQSQSTLKTSGKPVKSAVEMKVTLRWRVDSVDGATAKITQQIERVQVQLQPTGGDAVTYDSGDSKKPVAAVKDLASAVAPLVGAKFHLVMNDRGEILSAEPAPEFQSALVKHAASAPGRSDVFSAESVGRLLRQTLVVLPEKPVAKGATWSQQNSAPGPLGNFEQRIDYTLIGPTERAGAMLEQIDFVAQFVPPAAKSGAKLTIKNQTHRGTIFFAADAGRVVEAEQTQKLVTETTYRDSTIVVELETSVRSTVKPLE